MGRKADSLKLGKGAAFDKARLKWLRQEDDTWEADLRALRIPIEWPPSATPANRPWHRASLPTKKKTWASCYGVSGLWSPEIKGTQIDFGVSNY
jgi:hypothetical protein